MATYTVRADEKQELDVKALMEHYDMAVATKALLKAAIDVPQLHMEIAKLQNELAVAKNLNASYKSASESVLRGFEVMKLNNEQVKGGISASQRTIFDK